MEVLPSSSFTIRFNRICKTSPEIVSAQNILLPILFSNTPEAAAFSSWEECTTELDFHCKTTQEGWKLWWKLILVPNFKRWVINSPFQDVYKGKPMKPFQGQDSEQGLEWDYPSCPFQHKLFHDSKVDSEVSPLLECSISTKSLEILGWWM